MKLFLSILALLLVPFLPPRPSASGASLPVAASLFPRGMTLTFAPRLSNARMDAIWERDQAGRTFMHVTSQDMLRRVSGWLEQGRLRRGSDTYAYFLLFASEYGMMPDGRQGNATAFTDWRAAVGGINGLPVARSQARDIVPMGVAGRAETRVLTAREGGPTVTIAGWWGQSHEIEALAIFTPDVVTLTRAKRLLAAEVRAAVWYLENADATPTASTTAVP